VTPPNPFAPSDIEVPPLAKPSFSLSAVEGHARQWLHFDYAQYERRLAFGADLSTSLVTNG